MDWIKLCLLVGSIFASSEGAKDYHFVVAPNVIRFNNPETVLVNIFGNSQNVQVSVWLEYRGNPFSKSTVTVPDQASPVYTTVNVTESDIFNTVINDKPRIINLCSQRGNENKICNAVVLSYKTGYLIVQTDKPIYTPLQDVKIRVLALDESLKKVSGDQWQIHLDIVSPSNLTLGRRVFTSTSSSGFYQNAFSLPPYPEIGTWTARAFYGGHYETVARSQFQIEEYVLPTFGVTIDVSQQYILMNHPNDSKIDFTVIAKYVYGKPVAGKARLSFNVTYANGQSEYLFSMDRKELERGMAEFSVNIVGSEELRKLQYPDGGRLVAIATVFESATGKEENMYNDETVFAREPFIFKFTRSKRFFRPGMGYYLKVDLNMPNGVPAKGQKITVEQINDNGGVVETEEALTDSDGQALAIFENTAQSNRLRFKVIGSRDAHRQESDIFEVIGYDDKNQILVERVTTDDNIMLMNAFSNVQLGNAVSSYTGMLFVVVTRGKIVHAVFKQASNKAVEQIDDFLQELINPTARLLVFYVDENSNKVVADSIKIDVDAKCRGRGLSLKPDSVAPLPGTRDMLTITGTPFSWVGLNVIDKALLLLNDKNILVKNKMFDVLRSHDLGCGEGSGKNNGDVFKNAGFSILTNADVDRVMYRVQEGCDSNARKRRSADDCNGADERCCVYGKWYAETVINETAKEGRAKLDPYTLCYSAAKKAFKTNHYEIRCIQSILHSCIDMMVSLISEVTQLSSRSLEDAVSHYAQDLEFLANENVRPHKRTDFRESFMFEEVQLDLKGKESKAYSYPDSITEWMIQAIGITENIGMCIADPVDVRVFRKFFIQLDLPYKATRFELFDVKATLFNYGQENDPPKSANMYLEAVDGLCYGTAPGKPSPRKIIEVGPNSATTVRFPLIPLKAGKFSVKITAIVTEAGMPMVDIIEKNLYVVNEGIQEIITIQACLDPNKQREDCEDSDRVNTNVKYSNTGHAQQVSIVDLSLPNIAIQGTGSAIAYLQANVMDNVVQTILSGVDRLFRCPHGCGEQTIATTAPNVYAMMYLKQTNQVTADHEVTGNTHIRDGVNREKSMFRHSDGSYSCCNNDKHTGIYRATSVWLTAFVAKVFCHANTVVDDLLDEKNDIHPTINFLKNHMNAKGEFKEIQDTRISSSWLKGATKAGHTPSLTAFVLISLLECNVMQSSLNHTIDLATKYLETLDTTWLKNRPFDLAITTYALALAKSEHMMTFKNMLVSIEKSNGKKIYWAKPGNSATDAYAVETTAYALLAMLKFDDMAKAAHIVRWLTSQQNAQGVFKSTQDTVVGLQALSQYNIRTFSPSVNLKATFTANDWKGQQLSLKNEKFKLQKISDKLPVEKGDSKLNVLVTGTSGSGRMRIELRYNRPAKSNETCPFNISNIDVGDVYKPLSDRNISKLGKCDVCGTCYANPTVPNYNSLTTKAPVIVNIPKFGRKKRQAQANLEDNMKCIRFSVSALPGNKHGMSMIYFNLETDVTVLKEDMEKIIRDNDNMDDFEMPTNGNGLVVFYLNTLTSKRNDFVFRLVDDFEGDKLSRQPVSVDVFDYYDPDKYCRKIYGTGPNKGAAVDYKCDSKNKQCKCLQSSCAVSVDKEILNLLKNGRKPAIKLLQYTCNVDKANYADIIKVTSIWNDTDSKNTRALTEVTTSIHPGAKQHAKGDELTLFWKSSCHFPNLQKGKQYLIIGKDGYRGKDVDGNDKYMYPAMGSTLLIEMKGKLRNVVNAYKKFIGRKGCLNK